MEQAVETVVDGFRNLTPKQQTVAWIEIERIWKNLQDTTEDDDPDADA